MRKALSSSYHHYCPGESWAPPINLYVDDRNYYVVANLPGTTGEQIDIEIKDSELVISGFCATPTPEETFGTLQVENMEIDDGRFSRTLDLPDDVDVEKITATSRRGQLLVTIPKQQ